METLLCIDELAGALKLAEQTIRKWVLKKQVPFVKIGKVIRFKPSQIEQWIDSGAMAACIEGDTESDTAVAGDLFAETENEQ